MGIENTTRVTNHNVVNVIETCKWFSDDVKIWISELIKHFKELFQSSVQMLSNCSLISSISIIMLGVTVP